MEHARPLRRRGPNAAGRIHEAGQFADVGATVNAWLGGKSAPRGVPGTPFVQREPLFDDPVSSRRSTRTSRAPCRAAGYAGAGTREDGRTPLVEHAAVAAAPRHVLEVGRGRASSRSGRHARRGGGGRGRPRGGWSSSRWTVDLVPASPTCKTFRSRRHRDVRPRRRCVDVYHVLDLERGLAELARVPRPGGTLIAATNSRFHEVRELVELLVDAEVLARQKYLARTSPRSSGSTSTAFSS